MSKKRIAFGSFSENYVIRLTEAKNSACRLYLKTSVKPLSAVVIGDLASWNDPRVSVHLLPAHHLLEVAFSEIHSALDGAFQKRFQLDFRQTPAGGKVGYAAEIVGEVEVCIMVDCDGAAECEEGYQAVCSNGQVVCLPPPGLKS